MALAGLTKDERQLFSRLNNLGLAHLTEILRLPKSEDRVKLAEEASKEDLTSKEVRSRVKKLLNPEAPHAPVSKAGPAFEFHWKGRELQIKGRPFRPDQESWSEYSCALDDASAKYRAAFPLVEATPAEVTPAA